MKRRGRWAERTARIKALQDDVAYLEASLRGRQMDERVAFQRAVEELTFALKGARERQESAEEDAKEQRRLVSLEVSRRAAERQACTCGCRMVGARGVERQ